MAEQDDGGGCFIVVLLLGFFVTATLGVWWLYIPEPVCPVGQIAVFSRSTATWFTNGGSWFCVEAHKP